MKIKNEKLIKLNADLDTMLNTEFVSKDGIEKLTNHYKISGLYNYSFYNQCLIMLQGGTICQSYKNWLKVKRYVKKGEKCNIDICIPFFRKIEKEDKKNNVKKVQILSGFGVGHVFDISQTDGKPLEYDHNSNNNTDYNYENIKKLLQNITDKNISENITGNCRGYVNAMEIVISNMSNNTDKIKTLIHEIAHDILGHVNNNISSNIKEMEAESAAALVMSYLDISYDLSIEYINGWTDKEMRKNADKIKILSCAEKIIKTIKVA